MSNGNCEQRCVNQVPGYECQCDSDYSLGSDNMSCVHNAECFGEGDDFVCQCLDGFKNESGSGSTQNTINCVGKSLIMLSCIIKQVSILPSLQMLMNVCKSCIIVAYMLTVQTQLAATNVYATMATLDMGQIAVSYAKLSGQLYFVVFLNCHNTIKSWEESMCLLYNRYIL